MQHLELNALMRDLSAKINYQKKKRVIAEDSNLKILKYTQIKGIHEILECPLYKGFLPQITVPTRVAHKGASLIANIFTNSDEE